MSHNELVKAESKGRKSGLAGESKLSNPYEACSWEEREMWDRGWEDGSRLNEPYISDSDPR